MTKLSRPFLNALNPPPPTSVYQQPSKSVVTSPARVFNAIINDLSSQGAYHQVLLTFSSMLHSNTSPDAHTFPSLLKACSSANLYFLGISLHQSVIVNGYSSDPYVGSSLVNFYSKFGCIGAARKVFDRMPHKNVVPWTSLIGWCSREGHVGAAFSLYSEMRGEGIQPTPVTLLSLLLGGTEVFLVQCLHCYSIIYGFESDIVLSNSMINGYNKSGSIDDARKLFELMDLRDIVSWNSLISGYSQIGDVEEMLQLLHRMRAEGIKPCRQTYGSALSALAVKKDLNIGKLLHGLILKDILQFDHQINTALIVLYFRCSNISNAFQVFEHATDKDVVMWTAMISGLVQNDCGDKALNVFYEMLQSKVELNTATMASALAACAQLGCYNIGTSIHGYILRQGIMLDIPAQNSLVTMYAKCGHLEQSDAVFDRMERRDLVSWNAILSGYAKSGDLSKALLFFNEMRRSLQRPDSITVISLLQACSSVGALRQGKCIHNVIIRSWLRPCILVETALVDMYSKCGDLEIAQRCFDGMSRQDVISWGTIIAGYGSHGKGEKALQIYEQFLASGIEPNQVIFLSILSACSHNGLITQGLGIYQSMAQTYGLSPTLEQRACIIDLLGRAGRVEEAYRIYKNMFKEPTLDVLGILLHACRYKGNETLGEIIAEEILSLEPVDAENYVQLAHIHASHKRWDSVGEAWTQMKSLGLKKLPGWSSIELHGAIITFFSDHNSHHDIEDIMSTLKLMYKDVRQIGIERLIHFH